MEFPDEPFQRWYDLYPNIKMISRTGEYLNWEDKLKIGDYFLSLVETYKPLHSHPKQLGSEVVLRMYKSSQRRRWYDQVPALYRSFNLLSTLPETNLAELDKHCIDLAEHIQSIVDRKIPAISRTIHLYPTKSLKIDAKDEGLFLQKKRY